MEAIKVIFKWVNNLCISNKNDLLIQKLALEIHIKDLKFRSSLKIYIQTKKTETQLLCS